MKTPRWYRSAGLCISSVIPLDDLATAIEPNGAADLTIERIAPADADAFAKASAHVASAGDEDTLRVEIRRGAGGYLARWTGKLDIIVTDDGARMLVCERAPIDDSIARLLLNQGLSFALGAHGREGLHGSAVELGGRAILVSGPSGAGKSTLATALCLAGGRLLADDVVSIGLDLHGAPVVEPSTTRTWLEPSLAHEMVGKNGATDGGRMHKLAVGGDFEVGRGAVPLAEVLLLSYREGEPQIDAPLTSKQAIAALLGASFNNLTRTQQRMGAQFEIAAAVAKHCRVRVLHWARGPEAARRVANDMTLQMKPKGDSMQTVSTNGNGHSTRQEQRAQVIELLRAAGVKELPDDGHEELLLRTSQVAALLRSSDRTIRTWADAGKLKYIKTLGGRRLFPANEVLQVLASMRGNREEAH